MPSLVLTLIGPDRPGIVEALSQTIAEHGGNWLESRMAHLAGRFAGVLRVSVPEARADALTAALRALDAQGLRVIVEGSGEEDSAPDDRALRLEIVGQDRPGIVREIAQALARRAVNVEELATECRSAPMSGEMLFHATAQLRAPEGASLEELRKTLEAIANDLMVDVTLDDARPGRAPS